MSSSTMPPSGGEAAGPSALPPLPRGALLLSTIRPTNLITMTPRGGLLRSSLRQWLQGQRASLFATALPPAHAHTHLDWASGRALGG